ncbi:AraC family transcriptional regulator [Paenibacillus sp. UNC499MF]|uniref:AraC family transcriptional regulator n=1 Tax=Paenibacillus sp. UNC499MF TaxID=1502751 RepID=UPI0008A05ACC|nr:AraC family transcriptional regulator [Paenibacillus sp. UNC499MF]SEG67437.1 ABC-type Fe3+-hydroxamate transport system, substrate-binding protein [Paenibacillus sp. UNC499MF]
MPSSDPGSLPLRSLLFQFEAAEKIEPGTYAPVSVPEFDADEKPDLHTLLLISAGTGTLRAGDETFFCAPDKCYMIPPGTSYRLRTDSDRCLTFYRITCRIVVCDGSHSSLFLNPLIRGRVEWAVYPFAKAERFAELLAESEPSGELQHFYRQLQFQELMGFLLEHNLKSPEPSSSAHAVENSIRYIREHYRRPITVKFLAEQAQVPHWQFSTIFQELTGKKPLDFLNELRIEKAKEWLRSTRDPLREIARRVGFADEYYFNRRFRQLTGVTPRQYSQSLQKRTRLKDWTGHEVEIPALPRRVIYHGETFGDLAVLGVEAIGGGYPWINQAGRLQPPVKDLGFPINPALTQALKPDLIIVSSEDESQYDTLRAIAPTLTFDSFAPIGERMKLLGEILGRRREAETWLARYEEKASAMWSRLQNCLRAEETASVFTFARGRFFVMGTIGLSSMLFHPDGFRPAGKTRGLLDKNLSYLELSPEDMKNYAGDRLFVLLPSDPESRRATARLMRSPLWTELPAVRSGCWYAVEADEWNFADAITMEKFLGELPRLLGKEAQFIPARGGAPYRRKPDES